jgi:hypothetical protein
MQPPARFGQPWQARLYALIDSMRARGQLDSELWRRRVDETLMRLRASEGALVLQVQAPANDMLCLAERELWQAWLVSFEAWLRETGMAAPMQLGSLRQALRISSELDPDEQDPKQQLVAWALGQGEAR